MRLIALQIASGDASWFHLHEHPVFFLTVADSQTRTQLLGEDWGAGRGRAADRLRVRVRVRVALRYGRFAATTARRTGAVATLCRAATPCVLREDVPP